ncbi:MAG: CinA family protein [Devosiaceae bacterium]
MTDLSAHAATLLEKLKAANLMVATAESCTGGMIAAALTDIAGSSAAVERGFVTYSNEAKQEMLGVSPNLIRQYGAVSEQVARAMAEGALANSKANVAVSVTGVAGPGGGSEEKPVGTVHFACACRGQPTVHSHQLFAGLNRAEVRQASVLHAFKLIDAMVD